MIYIFIGESCAKGKTIGELKQIVSPRRFSFDCYDIYAKASDTATANTCVGGVIRDIQSSKTFFHDIMPSNYNFNSLNLLKSLLATKLEAVMIALMLY